MMMKMAFNFATIFHFSGRSSRRRYDTLLEMRWIYTVSQKRTPTLSIVTLKRISGFWRFLV